MIVQVLCLVLELTACATKSAAEPANGSLDTVEIIAELEKVNEIAGDDRSLIITKAAQVKELAPLVPAFDAKASVEPIQLFDNLYFVGDSNVGVFIFSTSEGYIMIACLTERILWEYSLYHQLIL
jgi:hypothetical protein